MTYDPNYNLSSMDKLNQIEPTYLSSYGLTEAPFSLQQDDRFFYSSPALTERLELLKHYTQYGNLLLIITGERGIGKSSLKQQFINAAQEEWQICEIQSHTMMDASLLLKQIANGFNITQPPIDPSALFEVLSEQLDYMHQNSSVPILLIDDAHELPQDSLQALLYLAENHSDQHTALRIILFCEPEIETMLEDPAIHSLKERVTHGMEIPALDESETAEYLRHRLAVAGLDGTSPFTPKLVNKIFKASEGVPAKINEYAHKNLLDDSEPYIPDELDLDDGLVHDVSSFNLRNMMLGGFAIALVITGLLFQDKINGLFEESDKNITEIAAVNESTPNSNTPASENSEIVTKVETPAEPQEIKPSTIELSLNESIKNEPEIKTTPSTKTNKQNNKTIKLSSVNPNPIPVSKQRQIISIRGSGFNKKQKIKVAWTGKEKILSETQVNITSDTYMNLILNVGMQPDSWEVTVIDPDLNIESNTISFDVIGTEKENTKAQTQESEIKTSKIKLTKIEKNSAGLYSQNWIKQQNKKHFTLQLLGTHNKNTLPAYLKKFELKDNAAVFKTQRNGKDWFTLIYGNHATKASAQATAKQLPKGVSKPWIRSFASILPSLNKISVKSKTAVISTTNTTKISENQEGWLWSQDPNHYTLQLAAGTDKKALQTFIQHHKLKGKAVYFHRLRDGKDWYILVHGSYAGYSKAKQAISQLPSAVQKAKPWTRSFGAIHAELN